MGRHAIAATTAAVERVVLRNLRAQIAELQHSDAAAVTAITRIVHDEQQHHDSAAAQAQASRWWRAVITPVVAASTETVIWLGMRL